MATWSLVDAHACSDCDYLTRSARRITEHLSEHNPPDPLTAAECRRIAARLPGGSGLRAALLQTADRQERGDDSPVAIPIVRHESAG